MKVIDRTKAVIHYWRIHLRKYKKKKKKNEQEAPQCDETRFLTIQPSIDVT